MTTRSRFILVLAVLCVAGLVTLPFTLDWFDTHNDLKLDLIFYNNDNSKSSVSPSSSQQSLNRVPKRTKVRIFGAKLKSSVLSRRFLAGLVALLFVAAIAFSLYFIIKATSQTQDIINDLEEEQKTVVEPIIEQQEDELPEDPPISVSRDVISKISTNKAIIAAIIVIVIILGIVRYSRRNVDPELEEEGGVLEEEDGGLPEEDGGEVLGDGAEGGADIGPDPGSDDDYFDAEADSD